MESVANYSYNAQRDEELSFHKGDTVKILSAEDRGWFTGEINGRVGDVPANHIAFDAPKWFKNIPKNNCEEVLSNPSYKFNFLVRPSETNPGEMSLSIKSRGIQHFKILRNNQSNYFVWSKHQNCRSINELVEYYKNNSVTDDQEIYLFDSKERQRVEAETVTALYNFDSRTEEELTIYEGETITLLERIDLNWIRGSIRRGGKVYEGIVPANYVE